jgi:hypothetical protein
MRDTADLHSAASAPSIRGTVAALAGLGAAWFAAGSTGLLAHPLRHWLAWLAGGLAVLAAWPGRGRWKDRLIVAVGRTPNVEGLNLEAAGVAYDKKGVRVDERMQTTNRRIYAAGDICFPYKFTHTADATARIVIQNALFFGRSKSNALTVPWCTYTDPEVAHVGLYPRDAEEKGIAVDTITVEMNTVDRAILEGDDDGFLDVYVKKGTDEILGATMVCRHAGDMISEISVAMAAGAGLGTIARTIHPYPTQAEAIKKAGDAYNRTRLTPRVQKIVNTLLKWRR